MSDTKNKSNAAAACGNMKISNDEKGIIIGEKNYSPSRMEINHLAGMEIRFDEKCKVTNETENGRIAIIGNTGKILGYLDDDNRTTREKLVKKDKINNEKALNDLNNKNTHSDKEK